jgi:hypothetical protein
MRGQAWLSPARALVWHNFRSSMPDNGLSAIRCSPNEDFLAFIISKTKGGTVSRSGFCLQTLTRSHHHAAHRVAQIAETRAAADGAQLHRIDAAGRRVGCNL